MQPKADGQHLKDTLANIRDTKEFFVSIATPSFDERDARLIDGVRPRGGRVRGGRLAQDPERAREANASGGRAYRWSAGKS
jgi:hypothetical protein